MSEAYKPRCDVPQRICSCPTAPATLVEHLSPRKSDKGNTSAPHKTAIYNMRVYATPPPIQMSFKRSLQLTLLVLCMVTESAHGLTRRHLPNCTQGVSSQTWFHRVHLVPRNETGQNHRVCSVSQCCHVDSKGQLSFPLQILDDGHYEGINFTTFPT